MSIASGVEAWFNVGEVVVEELGRSSSSICAKSALSHGGGLFSGSGSWDVEGLVRSRWSKCSSMVCHEIDLSLV